MKMMSLKTKFHQVPRRRRGRPWRVREENDAAPTNNPGQELRNERPLQNNSAPRRRGRPRRLQAENGAVSSQNNQAVDLNEDEQSSRDLPDFHEREMSLPPPPAHAENAFDDLVDPFLQIEQNDTEEQSNNQNRNGNWIILILLTKIIKKNLNSNKKKKILRFLSTYTLFEAI